MLHQAEDLVVLFNDLFARRENTLLVSGGEEPLYLPVKSQPVKSLPVKSLPVKSQPTSCHATNKDCRFNRVIFTRDYFASALHEVSHWCIAGPVRRQQVDYGYWYYPDGRTTQQQQLFESVEVKPQALEWVFAQAAGSRFRLSLDNLSGEAKTLSREFAQAVVEQARLYATSSIHNAMAERASLFCHALMTFYDRPYALRSEDFTLQALSF